MVSLESDGSLTDNYEFPGAEPWFLIEGVEFGDYKELTAVLFNGTHWAPVMNDAFAGLVVVEVELVELDQHEQKLLKKAVEYSLANPTTL